MDISSNSICVDADLKSQAETLFLDLGMNLTTAVNLFLSQAIRDNGLPISISENIPNEETILAIKEVEEMKKNPQNYKSYDNVDDLMAELLK